MPAGAVLIVILLAILLLGVWIFLGVNDRRLRIKIVSYEILILLIFVLSILGFGPNFFLLVSITLIGPLIFLMLFTPFIYKFINCKEST
ncbi:hypothetical protein CWB73_16335 [Pseudoalteromonas phenolica]|uniref:Uncharacterized protein n=1 Tax=Pseudoalteromonas phenolica TaxID=161398 RepID=A0A5S3YRC6_9GAMM|nr:hypothetical protein CWB73_16335 [Pseudoalteromonas phenolica]